jgi:CRISPR/Cas system-associated endonuclease Cas1
MAATNTVPQARVRHKSPIGKTGVLTLSGFGVRVRMQACHLEIEDTSGSERRVLKLPRIGHGLRRLVIIGSDGLVSLAALRWLADQQAAFIMLERDGRVLTVTGPVRPSDARLRRAQALAHQSGAALEISKELIAAKLAGQENLVRNKLKDSMIADVIMCLRDRLPSAENLQAVRSFEAQAASSYWSAWSALPISFPRRDTNRVPTHWSVFGTRKSLLTGSPRLATTPTSHQAPCVLPIAAGDH